MASQEIDRGRLREYMGRMIGHMTGGAICFAMWLGDELGLYRALAERGGQTADALADATGCHARLVAEWLNGQVAGGLVELDAGTSTYALSPEAAAALADDTSPVFVARGMNTFASLFFDIERIKAAFRGDGAIPWGAHDPHLFLGTEWLFRTGYRAHLAVDWLPLVDGVAARLQTGGAVADVGCGHGASAIEIARSYPSAHVWGFDSHAPSIATAVASAEAEGVADRATFAVCDAKAYTGDYDLICFFDCLHDMGDPVAVAAYAREHLTSDGVVLLVEPFALDELPANLAENPMAALFYVASSAVCTPNALSQGGTQALGAQAGEAALRAVFADAGYSALRRAAETTMNMVLVAEP